MGVVCESSSRNIKAQHQPLARATQDEAQPVVMPVSLSHESREEAGILISQSAIFDGEVPILCGRAGENSEHSTDPVAPPPVTSSNRRYIRRFAHQPSSMRELLLQKPDLPDTQRSQQQQPSRTSQFSPVEKEAIRWKGKPWLAPSLVRPPRLSWYIL